MPWSSAQVYENIAVERGPLTTDTSRRAEGGELLPQDFAIASDSRGFHMAGTAVVASSPRAPGSRGIFRRLIARRIFLARSQPDDRGYAR